ncbi:sorbin and SH3 domain-containing protein 1 [Drosophila madeirensis]|uniref:Sorbin and SH3 domain-containing protein 1 n=1 Tax=Drosophila madeirensis TaxID=30013 RepID=A0AAU9G6B0_DROMD
MLKFCSLRRGKESTGQRVSKSSSLRLQDQVQLSDTQLLRMLQAQREHGPLILALSSSGTSPTGTCRNCGTPYASRKVPQNGAAAEATGE